MKRIGLMALIAVCACGSGGTMQDSGAGGATDMSHSSTVGDLAMAMNGSSDMAGMMMAATDMAMKMGAGGIPDPGTMASGAQPFFDHMTATPDTTPATAIPEGTVTGAMVMAWVTGNMIAANATDYFVFKATTAGTFQLGSSGVCSGTPAVLAKIDLWNVVNNAQQTPPVMEWTPEVGTPTCISGTATLTAGNTYLIGFTANATGGEYSA